jgi:DNA-binding beta-propeller fold protein YncE
MMTDAGIDVAIHPRSVSTSANMSTGLLSIALLLATATRGPAPGTEPFDTSYLHSLSTSFGELPFSNVGLSYDPVHKELYVTGDGPVRVFNESGMEVYTFRDAPELGAVRSIASLEEGDLLALSFRDGKRRLFRCTFRGEFLGEVIPRNVPESLRDLEPSMMRFAAGKIYLVDGGAMRILVLDSTGEYLASYDVGDKLDVGNKRSELGLRGFGVDREGNLLFTIQPLFRAYVMSPAGEIRGFGTKGSAPGKFNIVGGITRDDAGNFYVADLLKSAILVFDPELNFVKEFGYRGREPGRLAAPEEIVAAGEKLFVSNRGRKGVSVFRVGQR